MMENINYIYTIPSSENYIIKVGEHTSVTYNKNEYRYVTSYSANVPFEYVETRS